MPYADNDRIMPISAEGLGKMMTVIVTVSDSASLILSEYHAAADTESGTLDLTARHRSSMPEI